MTPEELKARARRFPDEVLTQGDLAVIDDLIAADCVCQPPEPFRVGRDGLTHWVTSLRRAFPDLCAIVEDEITESNAVVQRLTLSGTHEGVFMEIPATHEHATWQLVSIQRTGPDGRFAEVCILSDQLRLLTQIGATPAAKGARQGTGTNMERRT